MRIAYKLPVSKELSGLMRAMSDEAAGAAIKAGLAYLEGGGVTELPAAAWEAFDAMRQLMDLSRKRAAAGRAGGDAKHFATGKMDLLPAKQPEPQPEEPLTGLGELGGVALAGLEMFM